MDFILNGQGFGSVAGVLLQHNMNPAYLRPWRSDDPNDPRSFVTVPCGTQVVKNAQGESVIVPRYKNLVTNTPATLRKDEWILLDEMVIRAAQSRLKAVADLMGSPGLVFNLPNGMAHTVLQHQTQSDIQGATVSMDGLRRGNSDRPLYELHNLPLPIVHQDFDFSLREVLTSRNGSTPLDTSTAELAGRKVAEEIERMLLGNSTNNDQYAYGGGTIYGYTDYPQRLTKTITSPTAAGWVPATLLNEVLEMRTQSQQAKHYGPWVLYTGLDWDAYMDDDFSAAKNTNTLRQRLMQVEGISGVRTLDYLTGYDIIMVQMTSNVIRMVNGMGITTLQWESNGGMAVHYKVMAINVPQLRCDYNSNTGIIHATVA